jgi:hypothetical protein
VTNAPEPPRGRPYDPYGLPPPVDPYLPDPSHDAITLPQPEVAPQVVVVAAPTSGVAAASLVVGVFSLAGACCTFGLVSIVAIVLGHLGMRDTRDGAKSGRGLAVAGLVTGYLSLVTAVPLTIWVLSWVNGSAGWGQ